MNAYRSIKKQERIIARWIRLMFAHIMLLL